MAAFTLGIDEVVIPVGRTGEHAAAWSHHLVASVGWPEPFLAPGHEGPHILDL